ncbi:MAG: class I SAM-dependent methyltransferase [Bacteroidota bacterium]
MKDFWEERYTKEEFAYGEQPNQFFAEELMKLQPGKILLPMDGEGRNAVYAAKNNWQVTAFDYAKQAQQKALQLAKNNKVTITFDLVDVEKAELSPNNYDAVAMIYAHLSPTLRKTFHQKICDSLKPDGYLILEGFHPKQLKEIYPSGGPKNEEMLYSLAMMEDDFSSLKIIHSSEKEITLNEGKYHRGKAYVTRIIAQKPQ